VLKKSVIFCGFRHILRKFNGGPQRTGVIDLGYKKHYSVHQGNDQFANGKPHINGIESFWSYSKRRRMKFHGTVKSTFYFHLKEREFRFNYRNQNIYQVLLKNLRKKPLI